MKDTSKLVAKAVLELAANKTEPKEAVKIVEQLVECYKGYKETRYEWITSTQSHCLIVEFTGRPVPFVEIFKDINTAIAVIHEKVMREYTQPKQLAPVMSARLPKRTRKAA